MQKASRTKKDHLSSSRTTGGLVPNLFDSWQNVPQIGTKLVQERGNLHFMEFHQTQIRLFFAFYCSIGFIVGTGQRTRMKGFIFRYKPTHAASFLSRPYVTLRNSPQVTEDLV